MNFEKYYTLVEEQSKKFDQMENCNLGQTWKYHLLPVINNAKMLAKKYHADEDVVELGAIFHDYADLFGIENRKEHHILGAKLARDILLNDGFDENFVERVCKCILNHRASVNNKKYSIEEICVADADALSHMDNVFEIIMWRAYVGETIEEASEFVKTKITKSYNKMSDQSKELYKDKYQAIMSIFPKI